MRRHKKSTDGIVPAHLLLILIVVTSPWLTNPVKAVRILPDAERIAANQLLSSMVNGNRSASHEHRRLSNVDVPLPSSSDEHLVTGLPLLAEDVLATKHWAGLLPASPEGDKYLFYWLFAPDTSQHPELEDSAIPLVIWLNGGPGCSSMDGLFLENGPLRFEQAESNGDFRLVAATHSWHKTPAYMLYIDQPVGTGLSFTTSKKYPRNDNEVNIDFYYFLQSFLNVHTDKFVTNQRLNRGLYFSGESHAGHYIPSMIAYILDQNANTADSQQIYCPVSGAAIGNGWTDPFHQYSAHAAAYGHGIIGRAQMTALEEKERECQGLLNQNRYASSVCFDLLDVIVSQSYGATSKFKVSQYDIRKIESVRGARTFPPGHKTVEAYLGGIGSAGGITSATMTEALAALHATPSRNAGQVYEECTNPPYDALSHQDGLGVVNEVVQILEHEVEGEDKVRLLFFNGVTDLICNHVGNEIMLEKLPWKHREDYIKAERSAWKSKTQLGDKISGYIKGYDNLLFLKVLDSGHMVPMDVPDVALDMMRLFIYGGDDAFIYSPQHLSRDIETNSACPSCPVCPSNISNYEIDSISATGREVDGGGNDMAKLGVGMALAGALMFGAFVLARRSRYGKHTAAATYDLEMRGGTYFDDPTDIDAGIVSSGPNGKLN